MRRIHLTSQSVKRFFNISLTLVILYILFFNYKFHSKNPTNRKHLVLKFDEVARNDEGNGTDSIQGFLNLHTWLLTCKFSLKDLKQHPLFPTSPQQQTIVNTLDTSWENGGFAAKYVANRFFGYIQAPLTGNYVFSLSPGNDTELWLSKDKHVENSQRLSEQKHNRSESSDHGVDSRQRSDSHKVFWLNKNKFYFIDIVQIKTQKKHGALVTWKPPDSKTFLEINNTYLFSYTKQLSKPKKLAQLRSPLKNSRKEKTILENTRFLKNYSKYLDFSEIKLALNMCSYKPGYTGKRISSHYQTVMKFVNPTFVYPETRHDKLRDGKWIPWFPLDEKDALNITKKFIKRLKLAYPGKYQLKRILNVERKTNWVNEIPKFYNGTMKDGDRYLLELQLWDNMRRQDVILSQFIYDYYSKDLLCFPENFQGNISTSVYLLISVRNQEAWLQYLIKNLEKIYLETKDENLHLIIYEYNTTELDIAEEFKKSMFRKYKVLKVSDSKYSRAYSLNRAAEVVSNPHAIIFTLDLHLEIPSTFPNNLRKHCIEGKMVYTPIIARLSCGAIPNDPAGSWDPWGYGMFGAYKSDWDRFRGFDETRFKTNWGGEDWDLIDRAYAVGLEFERVKHGDFYHYYHTRKGMW